MAYGKTVMRIGSIIALSGWAVPLPANEPPAHNVANAVASVPPAANVELTAMFDADQAARDHPATIDWDIVGPADAKRRARTQTLIDTGTLQGADDFYHAAYIFQHGDRPEDYLLAHVLAVVAIARGKSEATWIAAATLDRYLQRIGQPQIYGTQFTRQPGKAWTQEPYRRDLLPDAVRTANGVPPLKKQDAQLQDWARRVP